MSISNFQNFWSLIHKNQNFHFSKINTYKIFFFCRYPKKNIGIVWNYIPTTGVQNFKLISLFLAVQWPQNQVNVMTSLFWSAIFGISNCRKSKQMTFLETWDKTRQDRYVLKRNLWVSKFDLFWPELDLTLDQIWKWVSPSNSTFQITHKPLVTQY